ncbi:MAG: homoserine kinase [Planctomycetes bacterium]|nr:homoserine kinase [Planctomycetota bacterium]
MPPPAHSKSLSVRVPASTSNLGPGFDFAGLALSVFLDVRIVEVARTHAHEFRDLSGAARDWPRTSDNILLRAFEHARVELGVEARAFVFSAHSEIPVARGLGSSGAAIAAGVLLANALARESVSSERLCDFGHAIEGHPDNTSASITGGCTLAIPRDDGTLRVLRQPLHPDLGFAVAWPNAMLSTRAARSVLPREVSFADAIENPRRLAALLEGLRSADPELLHLGEHDRLHVRHRLALIENGAAALSAARAAGAWLATVSGSGSALFAIGPHARMQAVADALKHELGGDAGAEGRVVQPVLDAPVVQRV